MYVHCPKLLPDKVYLSVMYLYTMGREMHWDNPQTFNEKLQWLKVYDRKYEYTVMVDKFLAKKYAADKIGEEYIIPTLGAWERFEDIDFDTLPNQFVLKCTHDSGGLVICRDKSKFDKKEARKKIEKCLNRNFYWQSREWPYKNVKRKILVEKYMEDASAEELKDYKFYCFNGIPKFLYLSQGLENHTTARISYVTLDWKIADFYRDDYLPFDELPAKPKMFERMIELAKQLSEGISFLRVDFYEINGKIYFGEMTFYPGGGFTRFAPEEWDYKLGSWIELPKKSL